MLEQKQYLPVSVLDDNLSSYVGRKLELKLNDRFGRYKNGSLLVCRAGYYSEPIQVPEEDEDEEFMGYGIMISEGVLDGTPIPYLGGVYFMDIAGFRPLEGENTEEEKERWFQSAKG